MLQDTGAGAVDDSVAEPVKLGTIRGRGRKGRDGSISDVWISTKSQLASSMFGAHPAPSHREPGGVKQQPAIVPVRTKGRNGQVRSS